MCPLCAPHAHQWNITTATHCAASLAVAVQNMFLYVHNTCYCGLLALLADSVMYCRCCPYRTRRFYGAAPACGARRVLRRAMPSFRSRAAVLFPLVLPFVFPSLTCHHTVPSVLYECHLAQTE